MKIRKDYSYARSAMRNQNVNRILSADDCKRVAAFVQLLIVIDRREKVVKKKAKVKTKTRINPKEGLQGSSKFFTRPLFILHYNAFSYYKRHTVQFSVRLKNIIITMLHAVQICNHDRHHRFTFEAIYHH